MASSSLTVLMTVYNGMPYLPAAVASILAQEDAEFTFLIVNNGSADGTREYLESLQDDRLVIEHLPQTLSRPAVLNYALARVGTELTAILDADDLAAPQRLGKQRRYMCSHPDVVLLGCDVLYIDPQGCRIGMDKFAIEHDELCNKMPLYNQFAHAACMFRTQAVREAGGYPETFLYAQDFALWLRLLQRGARIASLPEALAHIRQHPAQATRDPAQAASRAKDEEALCQLMLTLPDLAPASRQAVLLRLALAQYKLGQTTASRSSAWASVCVNPLLLFFNPIFLSRLALWLDRKWKKRAT